MHAECDVGCRRLIWELMLIEAKKRAELGGRSLTLFESGRANLQGWQTRGRKAKVTTERPLLNVRFEFQ